MDIAQKLNEDGWRLAYKTLDTGSPTTPSRFEVVLSRNGQSITTPYEKGCGHRRWNYIKGSIAMRMLPIDYESLGHPKPGDRVKASTRTLFHEEIIRECTEPIPPTVDEVLYALSQDAIMVRGGETFEFFCRTLGYDTDSIKARNIFDACRNTYFDLIRLGADISKLEELFKDY